MGVKLRKRVRLRPPCATPPARPTEHEGDILAVLMYFPHQPSRKLASDILAGLAPADDENVRVLIRAIENYDQKELETVDPGFHVLKALKLLRKRVDIEPRKLVRPRAGVRKRERKVGRRTKCR